MGLRPSDNRESRDVSTYDISGPIAAELDRAPSAEVAAMSAMLAGRKGVLAILFYGNRLREAGASGLMDFYVLTEGDAAYHGAGLSALANRVLPPNVYFETLFGDPDAPEMAAKVAVMRLDAFRARMRPEARDTTLWARFSQPALLTFVRDDAARGQVIDAITAAFETGAWWAARLAAEGASPRAAWEALFTHTYGAELRVEGTGRAGQIVDRALPLYEELHATFIAPTTVTEDDRRRARTLWQRWRRLGKVRNVCRLIKAAFTFRGGIPYALSKVERHSNKPVELSAWERRVPWLAAPAVLIRLLREGRLR